MSENFFEKMLFPYPEKAILAEDISLPDSYDNYVDIKAKFYIPIFTPLLEQGEAVEKITAKPSTKGQLGTQLDVSDYTSANYFIMNIPRYILLNFKESIPKGTGFIVCSIGGSLNVKKFHIIGVY